MPYCPRCQLDAPERSRFCGQCGLDLLAAEADGPECDGGDVDVVATGHANVVVHKEKHNHYEVARTLFVCGGCFGSFSEEKRHTCPLCGAETCGGKACWDQATGVCHKCLKRGAALCAVCATPHPKAELRRCAFCTQLVCTDDACWHIAHLMCLDCSRTSLHCRADGCENRVLGSELRPCPVCGVHVCPECLPAGAEACRWCCQAVPCLPSIAIPTGRSVSLVAGADLRQLNTISLPHTLRSVSAAIWEGEPALLCGWRLGVYVVSPFEGRVLASYELPDNECHHGFNSAALHGHSLYATHRDLGICRWNLTSGEPSVGLWATELGAAGQYASCLRATEANELWCAAGASVYCIAGKPSSTVTKYVGLSQEVWGLAIAGDLVAACGGVEGQPAEGGEWAVWRVGRGDRPLRKGLSPRLAGVATVELDGALCILAVTQEAQIMRAGSDGALSSLGDVNLPQVRAVAGCGRYLVVAGRAHADDTTHLVVWDASARQVVEYADAQRSLSLKTRVSGLAALGG